MSCTKWHSREAEQNTSGECKSSVGRLWTRMMEFQPTPSDPCIYKSKKNVVIGLYVDDILIAGQDLNRINEIMKELSRHYELKDLGQMKSFLGVEIDQRPNGDIFLSQP